MHTHCTYLGLHDWSKRMFEKLGWMTLAARDGQRESIRGYLAGIKHLCTKIRQKIKETQDIDRQNDLRELLENVSYLYQRASMLLK